jgi:hypothetical protein
MNKSFHFFYEIFAKGKVLLTLRLHNSAFPVGRILRNWIFKKLQRSKNFELPILTVYLPSLLFTGVCSVQPRGGGQAAL